MTIVLKHPELPHNRGAVVAADEAALGALDRAAERVNTLIAAARERGEDERDIEVVEMGAGVLLDVTAAVVYAVLGNAVAIDSR